MEAFDGAQAEEHNIVQALAPQRAEEPLDEGLAIRRADWRANDFHVLTLERFVERRRKLPIPIMLHDLRAETYCSSMSDEYRRLVVDAGFVSVSDCLG